MPPLRVLLVESSEPEARRVVETLCRSGFEVESQRVDTERSLLAALANERWDLVVSDDATPRFGWPQVLGVLKDRGLDLPFIVMSDAADEERAVAALQGGAHDFIAKTRLDRLGPAVERQLREVRARIERTKVEQQFLFAQKMDAVGRLTGGIAHDFNNILAAIISFANFVIEALPEGDERRDDVQEILKAADRGSSLTTQLLAFSRQRPGAARPTDLNAGLEHFHSLLTRTLGSHIDLVVTPAARPAVVRIDPVLFDQVLLNLAVNARDAMPDGGRLIISLEHLPLEEGRETNGRVCLKVTDTGTGMDAATRAHLFEPFFTTKGGRGAGLGLATTHGIVADAGGVIAVDTTPGGGTTFRVTLPLCSEDTPSLRHAAGRVERPGHGEVVVVAEDDAALRHVARRVLQSAGYVVHIAADGDEAGRLIEALGERLDVLVTDVQMPGCSGHALAARVRRQCPGAAILLTSGFIEESERDRLQQDALPILWKPTPPRDLVRAVGQALERSGRRPPSSLERRVLLVEDDAAVAATLTRAITRAGCQVETASTLLQAEVALTARPSPQLILCDLQLGRESAAPLLTRLLAQDPTLSARLYILSGGAATDDGDRLLRQGHFRVLEKPLPPGRLQETLAAAGLISAQPGAQTPPRTDAAQATPVPPATGIPDAGASGPKRSGHPHSRAEPGSVNPRVLLVEDDPALIEVTQRTLRGSFDTVVATTLADGRAALADGAWDAIVLDIGLPDGSGLELLRELRGRLAEVPVVMMTGNLTGDAAATAVRARIAEYLQKPFKPHQLAETLRAVVEAGRMARLRTKLLTAQYGGDEFLGDLAATEATFLRALPKIRMVFQPIVRAVDSTVYAYEALLRCDEPALATPMRLFTAAEVLGRVEDVGRVVRARVAQVLLAEPHRLERIFLNVHPLEVRADLLAEPGDPLLAVAHRVVLEITERASLEGGEALNRELEQIRQLGYHLAVDDLGEGYAGLSSLVHLRPDVAKVDMSLVRDIHRMPLKRDIVAAIVDIARRSGITVVAEGIETPAERETLIDLGCDLLQGYLFAKPGPPFPIPRTRFNDGDALAG